MTLIRWNPMPGASRELATLHDEMDRLFDSVFTRTAQGLQTVFAPPVEVIETPDAFVLKADLPGVNQKDVRVSLLGDTLTIRGERKRESAVAEGSVHRSERLYGSFERSFSLGGPVRADQVSASYREGVLEVRVPKAEEAKVREIEVQVAS
jgi:HSP20 family protein